jgi:4-aminobutyrate aminotransferase-like enzyme
MSNDSVSWVNRDKAALSKRYRFPFLMLKEAKGINLKDIDGKIYLDFTSGGQTSNLGHKHPAIISAVKNQLERTGLASLGWALNDTRIELAEELIKTVPGQSKSRVGYCNTGSDATELSLRLAQDYTEKPMVICHFGCYHGQPSMGALALNTSPHGRKYGVPQVPGIFYVPFPYCYRCQFNQTYPDCNFACLDFIEYQFDSRVIPEEKVAAFFFEPVQVHGGVIPLPDGYLSRLYDICESRGILVVADEVTTGFGRTGKMFGIENWNTDIDIIYFAKSIASGLSLGAIISSEEIMSHFHGGGTFSGNPIACASSLATIQTINEQGLLKHSQEMGTYLRKRLAEFDTSLCNIGDIRGLGLLVGVELVKNNRKPATKETQIVIDRAAKDGLLMFPAGVFQNVLRLCPPLIIEKNEIDTAADIIEKALKK